MNHNLSLKSTLLTAAAALLCTGLQLAGIDSLAVTRGSTAGPQVVQLPTVLVSAQRDAAPTAVQQLPPVLVVGRRSDAGALTAQARSRQPVL